MTNPQDGPLDWNLVRTFVAVVEARSLAGAARALGFAHPTVARHIQQLEESLGMVLFDRRPTGLALNGAGARLVASARSMQDSARAFEHVTASVRSSASGLVRITVSDLLAGVLPGLLNPLRRQESDGIIQIDLLITTDQTNLLQHEADIAIRHVQPHQQDLVCRRLARLPYGLYASEAYLQEYGPPSLGDMAGHRFIDSVVTPRLAHHAERLGYPLPRERFVMRADSLEGQLAAAAAGWGITGLPVHVAETRPDLVRVLPDVPFRHLEMWLAGRAEVRTIAYLYEAFMTLADVLNSFVADVERRQASASKGADF